MVVAVMTDSTDNSTGSDDGFNGGTHGLLEVMTIVVPEVEVRSTR